MRIENTGESCETMQGTSYLEEKERDGGGGGEEEKKKKKICGTKEKASLIESACCGKCGVKNTVVLDPDDQSGIYRYSLEFLRTNEAVIERPAATNRRHAAYRFRI